MTPWMTRCAACSLSIDPKTKSQRKKEEEEAAGWTRKWLPPSKNPPHILPQGTKFATI